MSFSITISVLDFNFEDREEKISDNIIKNPNVITLIYEQIGTYGKEEDFDGTKIIRYYVPSGKYKVTAESKGSGLYVESISTHKENGYKTTDIYELIKFSNASEEFQIEVNDDQCISLLYNSRITLEHINWFQKRYMKFENVSIGK